MQKDDIPMLMEVHALSAQPIKLHADFLAEIVTQIQPQLDKVMTTRVDQLQQLAIKQVQSVLAQEMGKAMADAQRVVQDEFVTFLDKARAELATEIPKMLHASMAVIKIDLEQEFAQLQTQFRQEIEQEIRSRIKLEIDKLIESLRAGWQH